MFDHKIIHLALTLLFPNLQTTHCRPSSAWSGRTTCEVEGVLAAAAAVAAAAATAKHGAAVSFITCAVEGVLAAAAAVAAAAATAKHGAVVSLV
jgi:hypothetical protein